MSDFVAGLKSSFDGGGNDHILDLSDGMDYLNNRSDGIALLKRIGTNGFTYANNKHEWTETALATRRETITIDGSATSLAVANANQYQINNLIRCESEVMRVTAIADSTHLTVTRGYAGTSAAAHTSKIAFSMGAADPEGANAPAGINDDGDRLYNYNQNFTRAVSLTNDEIATMSTEGNPMPAQLERRFIEINRELFTACVYGVRYLDSSNELTAMGGLKHFVTTNVSNVGGALTIAAIDAQILAVVLAGGDPKVMSMSPYQKQKLDALDASKQMLGKQEHTGGNLITNNWQSGIMDHPIDIVVDMTFLTDELWILDTDYIEIGHKSHNGINGAWHVENSTPNGADREDRVIRGKYSMRVKQQKAHAYLYGLT